MGTTVLRTELCDMLGIEYPVILAGMGPVAGGGLALSRPRISWPPSRTRAASESSAAPASAPSAARGDQQGPLNDGQAVRRRSAAAPNYMGGAASGECPATRATSSPRRRARA